MPVSELIELDTRAVEASVVTSAPPVAKTEDGVMHGTRPTPFEPHGAQGLKPPDPRLRDKGSKAAREGPEAALRQTDPEEKNVDEPQRPSPVPHRSGQGHLNLSRSILISSQAHRISVEERPTGHLSLSNGSGICREAG